MKKMKKSIVLLTLVLLSGLTKSQCFSSVNYSANSTNPLQITFSYGANPPAGSFNFTQTWLVNNSPKSTDSTVTLTFPYAGTFTVCLHLKFCLGGGFLGTCDSCFTINVTSMSTGIKNQSVGQNNLIVFPNPANEMITIKNIIDVVDKKYTIININGAEVLSGTIEGETTPVNISTLDAGMYIVKFNNQIAKIVKN